MIISFLSLHKRAACFNGKKKRGNRNGKSFLNQEPELIDILFSPSSIEQSENTPVYEFNNSVIVARVVNHRLPMIKTFEEIEDEIKNILSKFFSIDLLECKKLL